MRTISSRQRTNFLNGKSAIIPRPIAFVSTPDLAPLQAYSYFSCGFRVLDGGLTDMSPEPLLNIAFTTSKRRKIRESGRPGSLLLIISEPFVHAAFDECIIGGLRKESSERVFTSSVRYLLNRHGVLVD